MFSDSVLCFQKSEFHFICVGHYLSTVTKTHYTMEMPNVTHSKNTNETDVVDH